MGITLQQKGLAQLYGRAATLAGRSEAAVREEQLTERRLAQFRSIEAQKESQQIAIQQQTNMKLLDAQLDLEMYERSKRWEIDKMELRSRMDFEREEQSRGRRLDSADNAIQQIEKEVLSGRMTEKEAYPLKQKLELSKLGVNVPTSEFAGKEDKRYGVDPYWMRGKDAPEGTPERQLYETKIAEGIAGEETGVRPHYYDPEFISRFPDVARQELEKREIFFDTDEEWEEFRTSITNPLANKQLDIGERVQPTKAAKGQYTIGQTVTRGGKSYTIVGFDTDGEPLVELKR